MGEAVQVTLIHIIRGLTEKYALQVSKKPKTNTEKKKNQTQKAPHHTPGVLAKKCYFSWLEEKVGL